ncbi:MAG TPA: hypothetical protein PLU96_07340 [Methanofastidiosum sp.]|jgi:hypothetical protein|nr:hypothetical protein [Methanofastidiosum sp.]
MNYKLSIFAIAVILILSISLVSAEYPSIVDDSSSSAGVGPQVNPDGSYTFIVESPPGVFSSVSVVIGGKTYPMEYSNTRWIVTIPGLPPGTIYYYNIVTSAGVVFSGANQKL